MVFSSLLFLFFFLPITLILYVCSPRKLKNLCLLIVSLIFYAWGEPVYVALMITSTVTDYSIGLALERARNMKRRKQLLIVSIMVSIGILGFFKYYAFLAHNIEAITGIPLPDWNPPLPIGISFYTFQTMSYTIDIYRREIPAQRSFINFGCYVALFPQLIAGPIVRYRDIQDQLEHRVIASENVLSGSRLFLIGLGKKVLLANNIGALWATIQTIPGAGLTAATAWLGIIAFAFQIYFDFSGYSDMARGLGRIFGFDFPINFNYPYISQSITDFWRRWHMTLGGWFRDYVYIPLGGNRVDKLRQVRNIVVVWLLTGLWHGASWNFVLWGLYFGVILMLEKIFLITWLNRTPQFLRHSYACILILIGWVLFAVETLPISDYFLAMIGLTSGFYNQQTLYLLTSYGSVLVICTVASTPIPRRLLASLFGGRTNMMEVAINTGCLVFLLMSIAYLVDATYNPFLYFRF